MKVYLLLHILVFLMAGCSGQSNSSPTSHQGIVGGPCEGCEAILEYGDKVLTPIDTVPGYHVYSPTLKLSGTVYERDGVTPASDVMIYIYQTNREGLYQSDAEASGWKRRHGSQQGWVKTGPDGRYNFYTFRPAAYPDGSEPEHIHVTIKEPHLNEYYIDEFAFDDDPLLSTEERTQLPNRGGSGVVKLSMERGILTAKRDIICGLNIPDYR